MAAVRSVPDRPVSVLRDVRSRVGEGARAPAATHVRGHRQSLILLSVLLAVVAVANAWNLHGWPGMVNDDEGTYVAQAWAMITRGDISHYTYWYDHPFLGWALIAGYSLLTDGFDRLPYAIMVGREFMVLTTLVTCALLFLLARRLHFGRLAAATTVLTFGLSPLAVFFHRMVFLDNIAVLWAVAALAIAASPRRSLSASFWTGVCMAAAVWTKETIALLLPAVVWMLVRRTDRRTRRWNLAIFGSTFATIALAYPLYAALNNELLPGEGHVSLAWAVWWQIAGRSGSGSLLDPSSGTFSVAMSWVDLDPWLLLGGVLLVPFGFAVARLRPLALALFIQVLMMLRGGYLPFAYVVAMLPFAALLIGGLVDLRRGDVNVPHRVAAARQRSRHRLSALAEGFTGPVADAWRLRRTRQRMGVDRSRVKVRRPRESGRGLVVVLVAVFALVTPVLGSRPWADTVVDQVSQDGSVASRAATRWVIENLSQDAVVVTDDYIWTDLVRAGYQRTVWLWKVDTDPAVMTEILPNGYESIDYIVLAGQAASTLDSLPTLKKAIASSVVLATFGQIEVRKVEPGM